MCLEAGHATDRRQDLFFPYGGNLLIVEFTSAQVNNQPANTVTAVNTFGANGLVSRNMGTTSATGVSCAFDPQGNVCQRLDSSGNVLSGHFFDAYGAEHDQPSATKSSPFGYGGQWGC